MLTFGASKECGLVRIYCNVNVPFAGKFKAGNVDFPRLLKGFCVTIQFNLALNVDWVGLKLNFSINEVVNLININGMG